MPRSFLVKTKQQQQRYDVTERTGDDVRYDADDVRVNRRLSQSSQVCDTPVQFHTGRYLHAVLTILLLYFILRKSYRPIQGLAYLGGAGLRLPPGCEKNCTNI